jgi:hypothetical protein
MRFGMDTKLAVLLFEISTMHLLLDQKAKATDLKLTVAQAVWRRIEPPPRQNYTN